MPGRDGLLHISKMSPLNGGKRIGQVEDVLELGQAIDVRVDDIDPQGKVSLSLAGEYADMASDEGDVHRSRPAREPRDGERSERPQRSERSDRPERSDRGGRDRDRGPRSKPVSSFESSFEAELAGEIGDLGPAGPSFSDGDGGSRRGPRPRRR
jgi:polyribonucleotide nucleotidyltransferase